MKKVILMLICLAVLLPLTAKSAIKGDWSLGGDVNWVVPTNSDFNDDYTTGLGVAGKGLYGLWSWSKCYLSGQGEFEYDLVFEDNDKNWGDKHLFNLAIGPRFTHKLGNKFSPYIYGLCGSTIDVTMDKSTTVRVNYSFGTGIDYLAKLFFKKEVKIGPIIKFRHVISDPDLISFNFGAGLTYPL